MPLDASTNDPLQILRLEAEALRGSRARIVAASDADQRMIERDLHDGVQQHLVALAVNLQLARQLLEADVEAAKELLDEIARDVHEALDSVRELAQRVHPPLLLDRGLIEALRAAAATAAIRTRIEATALERLPGPIESAVYFCCVETVRDAEARARSATVRLWRDGDVVRFEVMLDADDLPEPGNDVIVACDRLEALGGTVALSARAGDGARVAGTVPVEG